MAMSNELKLLRNMPKWFLTRYWVQPSPQYSQAALPDGTNPPQKVRANVFLGQKAQVDSLLSISGTGDKVAWANVREGGGKSYFLDCFHGDQLTALQKPDLLPIWYLPWWADHVTKMRILRDNQMPGNMPNPDLFFTTALTGCTIFVEGPANSPTVYHAGFDSNRNYATHPKLHADSVQHWRLLFNQHTGRAAPATEANKTDYMAARNQSAHLQAYMNLLRGSHEGKLVVEELHGEGAVFGIRDRGTRNWTFYLQEDVTVQFKRIRREKRLFRPSREVVDANPSFHRQAMCLREIFPNAAGPVTWNTDKTLE